MDVNPVVVAVDGGGTKTDAAALTLAGAVVARRRGPGSSPHYDGLGAAVAQVDRLVQEVAGDAEVRHAGLYLSGLDLPREIDEFRTAIAGRPWARRSLAVDNDLFALLRAGTDRPDAIAVVCGTGTNAIGVRADGRTARFHSLGSISGDWGGGHGLGQEALWHAAREADGRGPSTLLTSAVTAEFGMPVPLVTERLHSGELGYNQLSRLAPAVFAAADDGDPVAVAMVDRQADEIVAYVRACLRRLGLTGVVPVVLGGGILQAGHPRLLTRIAEGVQELNPRSYLVQLAQPPLLGAALLALADAGASSSALAAAASALGD
ncbi:MAG: BadF/BadG/BcrA/BcrD ATPase family protein [Propionicimonas sp.]